MKHRLFLSLLLILSLLSGCAANAAGLNPSDMFTSRDMNAAYDPDESIIITLNGSAAECVSGLVRLDGSKVTLTGEGIFILRGTLDHGMIIVDAGKDDKLHIVLDGVQITSRTSAPLYIRQADKVVVTLAEGSENVLANGGEFVQFDDNDIDAAIYSRDDLTLNGSGSLRVDSPDGHGIVSKDDLVLTGGVYSIISASHGLSANDSVRLTGVTMTITSGKDGIQAEHDEDPSLGYVYMENSALTITSDGDGMSATGEMLLTGGTVSIVTGGGSAMYVDDDSSRKGLKADGGLTITGGTFTIDACEDALHTNANLTISGGTVTASAGDDALHADADLVITDGMISVPASTEAIEGYRVTISGGEISVCAADDGINAAGDSDLGDFAADPNASITISGGTLFVSAEGDGIDSNGALTVSGGYTVVAGPTRNGNGAVDYSGEAAITGGTFIAYGAAGMAQSFGHGSTQGAVLLTADHMPAGTAITLADGPDTLLSVTAEKGFSCVVVSSPQMEENGTYTLTIGDKAETVTLDGFLYSNARGRFRH